MCSNSPTAPAPAFQQHVIESAALVWDVHTRGQQRNPGCQEEMKRNAKHTADTLRNGISSCYSIPDARNLSHVCSERCYGATGDSLNAREGKQRCGCKRTCKSSESAFQILGVHGRLESATCCWSAPIRQIGKSKQCDQT